MLQIVLQREVVVAIAVAGALTTAIGSFAANSARVGQRLATAIVRLGYAISGASVALFIAAGFMPHS